MDVPGVGVEVPGVGVEVPGVGVEVPGVGVLVPGVGVGVPVPGVGVDVPGVGVGVPGVGVGVGEPPLHAPVNANVVSGLFPDPLPMQLDSSTGTLPVRTHDTVRVAVFGMPHVVAGNDHAVAAQL